jgi:hypothetical protein
MKGSEKIVGGNSKIIEWTLVDESNAERMRLINVTKFLHAFNFEKP